MKKTSGNIVRIAATATIAFLLLCCCLFTVYIPALAEKRVAVRVAFPLQKGMTFYDEQGKRAGYTYEYLREVAQYAEFDYEFEDMEGANDDEQLINTLKMIKSGDLDVAGGWSYSESLAQEYGFTYSSHSYGSVETVLQAPYDSGKEFVINSQLPQTFRIAVIEGANRTISEIEEFCKTNKVTPVYVYCASPAEQLAALKKPEGDPGYAELMSNTSFNYTENVRTVARFAPKPFYFIVSEKASPAIIEALDRAMINIDAASPLFVSSLYEKYFLPDTVDLKLSGEELSYIDSAGTINVGILKRDAPFQYLKGGKTAGIAVDLLSRVSERTGLKFNILDFSDYSEMAAAVKNGEIKLLGALTYDYELAEELGVSLTRSYLQAQYVELSKASFDDETLAGKKAAVCDAYRLALGGGDAVVYPDLQSCIDAVLSGKADYTYTDAYAAQYFMTQPDYAKLKYRVRSNDIRRVSFGVRKGGNKTLLGILNKTLTVTPESELLSIVNRNLVSERDFSLAALIRAYPLQSVVIIAGISFVIVAMLAAALIVRALAESRRKEQLSRHYRLFGLVSEALLEYDYVTRRLIVSNPDREGDLSVMEFDFSLPPGDETTGLRRERFLSLLNGESGVKEAEIELDDGKHWIKIALETENKNGAPVYTLGKFMFIDEEKRQESTLVEQARQDSLTHLYNAETTREMVTQRLKALKRGDRLSLILADIDLFKQINDTHGHLKGDDTLIAFAKLLKTMFPGGDVGRPGGDEFTVCLPKVGRRKLEQLCRETCRRARQIEVADGVRMSVSLGAAVASPGESFTSLYDRADRALYEVKNNFRDGFKIASPSELNSPEETCLTETVQGADTDSEKPRVQGPKSNSD